LRYRHAQSCEFFLAKRNKLFVSSFFQMSSSFVFPPRFYVFNGYPDSTGAPSVHSTTDENQQRCNRQPMTNHKSARLIDSYDSKAKDERYNTYVDETLVILRSIVVLGSDFNYCLLQLHTCSLFKYSNSIVNPQQPLINEHDYEYMRRTICTSKENSGLYCL
jgi:hypothetical protein